MDKWLRILESGPGTIKLKNGRIVNFDYGDYDAKEKLENNGTLSLDCWNGSYSIHIKINVSDIADVM